MPASPALPEGVTPGPWAQGNSEPWFVDHEDASYITWAGIKAADGEVIALVVSRKHYDDPGHLANISLIAAAPELLQALEKAEVLCTAAVVSDRMEVKGRPQDPLPKEILARSEATLAEVRAALAKAKGDRP